MGIYQQGNTIRIDCQFHDFDGNQVDPINVKLRIYDSTYKLLDTFEMTFGNRTSVGKYFYDYVSNTPGTFYYEWYGEYDGSPILRRDTFKITFV